MNKMQDFRQWLSSSDERPTAHRRRLAALTRLDRTQLANLSNQWNWFLWSDAEKAPTQ